MTISYERLLAERTLMRPLYIMELHVLVQRSLLGEFFLANRTFVWDLFSVLQRMTLQMRFCMKYLLANRAFEGVLPLRVGRHVNA